MTSFLRHLSTRLRGSKNQSLRLLSFWPDFWKLKKYVVFFLHCNLNMFLGLQRCPRFASKVNTLVTRQCEGLQLHREPMKVSAGLTGAQVCAFEEARTALRAAPVHGPHSSPVGRLVANPAHRQVFTQNSLLDLKRWEGLTVMLHTECNLLIK